ncbi:MAG TPA: hypothetical protein VKW06_08815 [Candidatus Angelobacter sp.]|nr:hypothetical protein [Candidatus Angelobacter sp.]
MSQTNIRNDYAAASQAIDRALLTQGARLSHLSRAEVLPAIIEISGLSETEIANYFDDGRESFRTDGSDIALRLFANLNLWVDKLSLIETPNGGWQLEANPRISELRENLRPFGFFVACCIDAGGLITVSPASGRDCPFYRLVRFKDMRMKGRRPCPFVVRRERAHTPKKSSTPERPRMIVDAGGQGLLALNGPKPTWQGDPESAA